MKIVEKVKKHSTKITDDKNIFVVIILFLYMSLIILGKVYDLTSDDLDKDSSEIMQKHIAVSEITGEDFGTVIAKAKEMDGHCEYRACKEQCDWYDNSNSECNGLSKGDWIAKYNNETRKGISLCSETKGEFAKVGNPSRKQGAYCWCKSGKNWVHHLFMNNTSYCSDNGCAGNCAHGFLYSPVFRSALNSKIRKTK